jgi:hypothetical protein
MALTHLAPSHLTSSSIMSGLSGPGEKRFALPPASARSSRLEKTFLLGKPPSPSGTSLSLSDLGSNAHPELLFGQLC